MPPKKKIKPGVRFNWCYVTQSISAMLSALGDMHELHSAGLERTKTATPTHVTSLRVIISRALDIFRSGDINAMLTIREYIDHKRGRGFRTFGATVGLLPQVDNRPQQKFLTEADMELIKKDASSMWHSVCEKHLLFDLTSVLGQLCDATGCKHDKNVQEISHGDFDVISGLTADVILCSCRYAHDLGITKDIVDLGWAA